MMDINGNGYDEEMVKRLLQVKVEEQLEAPKSAQEFEKFFTKKIQDPMQRYTYMRLIDLLHYKAIFIGEFDSELLIKIMQVFKQQVVENESFNNPVEQQFIFEFLSIVVATPNFEFSLEFLGSKEKELIGSVLTRLNHLAEEQRAGIIKKFKI